VSNLNNRYSLVFDVGGRFIKAAVLNDRGQFFSDTISFYPSKADADRETLLEHLADMICQQVGKIIDKYYVLDGIAFAFPGPFDYENGICLIRGVNKFDSLYEIDLRAELTERLRPRKMFASRMGSPFSIVFENNADMFALGEWLAGTIKPYRRTICLTVGNGTGSAFLEEGRLIKWRKDVPSNGWVYNVPFKDAWVDDYISTRGIERLARDRAAVQGLDVEEMADLARKGQADAQDVFRRFGQLFGEMLQLFIPAFQPDALFIGGQIAHCYDLFSEPLQAYLKNENVLILTSTTTSNSTFIGISKSLHASKP
jgi:glucokinase